MMNSPIIVSGCVILDEKGRVLLIHKNTSHRVQWETPGGRTEAGEQPAEGAQREVKEEMGVVVEIVRELGFQEFASSDQIMNYFWFHAVIVSGQLTIRETSLHDEWRYFYWEELLDMKPSLSANARNLVDAYFSGRIQL